jgi:hypothetical protein
MIHSFARHLLHPVFPIVTLLVAGHASAQSKPAGHIDPSTWVSTAQGTFDGIPYTRYEAMFEGVTSNQRPFRVPCQIIAPTNPAQGSGLFLFDWLVPSTIPTAVGQEQADARHTLTDEFLFGRGVAYATVRCDLEGIGKQSPVSDPSRPWSDDLLDTSSEFITSAGDEFDIVVAYLNTLRTDPVAVQVLGPIQRRAAFAYSAAGYRLRGLLRLNVGIGLFDFSLVGGTGNGFSHPSGNKIGSTSSERAPLAGAGLAIDFQSETDVLVLGAHKPRHEEPNYRVYQFAGPRTSAMSMRPSSDSRIPRPPTPPIGCRSSGRCSSPATTGATGSSRRRASGSERRTLRRSSATPTGTRWSPTSAGNP